MSDFTFFTFEQCFRKKPQILLKRSWTRAALTDFAILSGAAIGHGHVDLFNETLDGRTGYYWTKSEYDHCTVLLVEPLDGMLEMSLTQRFPGARPVLPFSDINELPTNDGLIRRAKDGIIEVEYGYYPQQSVPRELQEELEEVYKNESILKTGNSYTTDARKWNELYEKFTPKQNEEYEYKGKRYVRMQANYYDHENYYNRTNEGFILSNGESYKNGEAVWVEVSPVKWLVDEIEHIMVTDKLIFGGIEFNDKERISGKKYHTIDFAKTTIKKFMDKYLSKELFQVRAIDVPKQTKDEVSEKQSDVEKRITDGHSAEEAKAISLSGISAFREIGGAYQEYLDKENTKEEQGRN